MTDDSLLRDWLSAFAAALEQGDIAAVVALFVPDCNWRDLLAFTWNIKTLEGRPDIAGAALVEVGLEREAEQFSSAFLELGLDLGLAEAGGLVGDQPDLQLTVGEV